MEANNRNDKWQLGDAYERYMGRWSREVAPRFLHWMEVPADRRWLDVGCGTGALCAEIVARCAPRSVVGIDPSEGFLATARQLLPAEVVLHRASAGQLPLDDSSVDATVSALMLNFVPDAGAALREMVRVTATGGSVGAYVWDYARKMDLIRLYWDVAAQFDAQARAQDQGERFPLCQPDALASAFADAGLRQVEVSAIEIPMRFADFDDYWRPFLAGQGPAPAHAMQLEEPVREQLRERLRERMPVLPDGSILLQARALTARGRR
ncbi:class I SAM-dependent methyltransferase [Piscinibacter sp. XHJ-5]|uniref:class I SAM-dependent methyltransferase n=1 Tax=Piscinibacter sp. XHJ-5 TaxID=3037797 RepID=UPI0024532167|nr:class I SAM-dependent methyltransferase [Piscinibacter sp. XHJ-5]